jgi:RimJ/RimL family protein N-acetyltransferase
VLDYIAQISGESDFLTFGPGEFVINTAEEADILQSYREKDNRLYILGLIDDAIVATLSFSGGHRPRIRHTGEFGMSVRKPYWGQGIGSAMLEALIDWARDSGIVTTINLRVRTDNARAIALYERKGFGIEGTINRAIFQDGRYFDHHWMGLAL